VAWRRVAGHVAVLAVLPRVFLRTLAIVASELIDAQPAIPAGYRACVTLVDVLFAGLSGEEGRAAADVVGLDGVAFAAVGTRV